MPGTAKSGGRNRKSAQQHRLEGTYQKCRHTGGDAPEPPTGTPPVPAGLAGVALDEWRRMVDRLEASRTLSRVDDAALYQYCRLHAETEAIAMAKASTDALIAKLEKAVQRFERDERISDEQLVKAIAQIAQLKKLEAKHATQLRQGHMAIRQFLVEFGMTPAARSRVKVPDAPAATDQFAEFGDATTH
jgi:P27 family predicted phage terminase small subunit